LRERMPPPTGVVSGPLIPIRWSRKASTVSSGSQSPVSSKAFWPASTSFQATLWPCLAAAASRTSLAAGQMSTPVPSPSMKGMMGSSGTTSAPSAPMEMRSAMDRMLWAGAAASQLPWSGRFPGYGWSLGRVQSGRWGGVGRAGPWACTVGAVPAATRAAFSARMRVGRLTCAAVLGCVGTVGTAVAAVAAVAAVTAVAATATAAAGPEHSSGCGVRVAPLSGGTRALVGSLTEGTITGTYLVTTPRHYNPRHAYRLVLLFYGAASNPAQFSSLTGMPARGAAAGDIVVVPHTSGTESEWQFSGTGSDA